MKIEIYDTTLRDGGQSAGVTFTLQDKIKIIHALDSLGVDYIEAGNFDAEKEDMDSRLFSAEQLGAMQLSHAKLVAFGATRRAGERADEDEMLIRVANSPVSAVAIVGKSWLYQVHNVIGTTAEENEAMIADTIRYLKGHGKEVIFDAEHFFDGYSDDPAYALHIIGAARDAGATTVVLCDTNGGMLSDVIGVAVTKVKAQYPDLKIGIHCHNDLGLAVAGSVSAVTSGACQVQGTVSGFGERCGNANLNTVVPILQYKLGYDCIAPDRLRSLTPIARYINEIANRAFDESEPFVGGYAFSHKAGLHIDAVQKAPRSMEHMDPELIGNKRDFLISAISGRSAIRQKMTDFVGDIKKDSPEVKSVLARIKEAERQGYQYENAEASLSLLIREALGMKSEFFDLIKYQVISSDEDGAVSTALIKISVDGAAEITAAEGEGPVNALDLALRKALARFYPIIEQVKLTDFKVRVLDSGDATASQVRVFIESTDGVGVWRTIGVSKDIIEASKCALVDTLNYRLAVMTEKGGV